MGWYLFDDFVNQMTSVTTLQPKSVAVTTSTTKPNSADPTEIYDQDGNIQSKYDLLKTKLHDISNEENENIKVAIWNTYYYKKYKMESNFLLFIISICILIIILTFLHRTYPYFDESAYMISIGFVLAVSILLVIYLYFQIYNKDDMNFDENDYGPNNINRMQAIPQDTGYVDINTDISCNSDPRGLANSNFLNKLF